MKNGLKILIGLIVIITCAACNPNDTALIESATDRVKCELLRVVDGDTLVVMYDSQETKVRLIGIDAPESVNPDASKNSTFGEMASNYTKEILSDIQYIYLEFDIEKRDDYGRLLAYAYITESSNFENSLNYVLVEDGYAINKEYPPNLKYADSLKTACELAYNKSQGLWNEEDIEQIWNE